jgi:hypothetical protein
MLAHIPCHLGTRLYVGSHACMHACIELFVHIPSDVARMPTQYTKCGYMSSLHAGACHAYIHAFTHAYTPAEMAWMPSHPMSLYPTFTCVMRLFVFKNSASTVQPSSVILFHEKSSADMYGMSVACHACMYQYEWIICMYQKYACIMHVSI